MKTKKRSAMLSRRLQDELRLQQIGWLASGRVKFGPTAAYSYSFPLSADMEVGRDEIAAHGVAFETGSPKDLVQVRIRPDVPAKAVVAILIQVITAVSEHGRDWMQELSDATERVKAQLKEERK